jgi:uncharacterized protein (DUF488 family)
MRASPSVVYTIGHSTRTIEEFLSLLRIHGIRQLADIRTVPRSKRHPHFEKDALDASLAAAGIGYRHYPSLGGLRKPRPDSTNTAWQHPAFRGYADHMETVEFRSGVEALIKSASEAPTVVMCAESVWWRCHRRLLSDALLVRGVPVLHILSAAEPKPHELSEFARAEPDGVTYPGLL